MDFVRAVATVTGKAVATILIIAVALFVVVQGVLWLLPSSIEHQMYLRLQSLVTGGNPIGLEVKKSEPGDDDSYSANESNEQVSAWITHCFPQGVTIPRELSRQMVWIGQTFNATDWSDPVNDVFYRVAALSQSITMKRAATASKVDTAYSTAQIGAFLTIGIGLLTTIFVSLSTMELFGDKDKQPGKSIRIAALILPAIGTATAALIAFYDPNGNLARQSQIATGLRQVHTQLVITLWKTKCPASGSDEIDKDTKTSLDAYEQKFQDLIASTGDAKTPTGQSAQGAGNANTGGGSPGAPTAGTGKSGG
ncbi:hypothetical protein [Paraburkholderia sp. J7]|uniref:hypothetical protein n=1 Tax=Paraburkholderia sp. J7 TaxID=2805438 RepID=UPI002AB5F520|nr:hypothetical protein [Paraburkholderia sp. J7]